MDFRLLVGVGLTVLLSGCLALGPPAPESENSDTPAPVAAGTSSGVAVAKNDDPAPEDVASTDDDEDGPYIRESKMKTSRTGVSTGVFSSHEIPSDGDHFFLWCLKDAPDAVRVVVEWEPWYPYADVEFALVYPSEPEKVRGASPLVWEHELEDQDERCFDVWLEPDSEDVNVLLGEPFTLFFTWAFNGAELP